MVRFSRPVRFSSTAAYWPASPILVAQLRRLAHGVEAGHAGLAAIGGQQRGEDAHDRRLAGPVGAEQAEHGAGAGVEVDPGQGLHVTVGLVEVPRDDGGLGARAHASTDTSREAAGSG